MAVAGSPEQLVELLSVAARTPGGEIGLLRTAQVAQILGRRRDWVQRNARRLGGFRLPGSDEWRFSPGGGWPIRPPARCSAIARGGPAADRRGDADGPPGSRQR